MVLTFSAILMSTLISGTERERERIKKSTKFEKRKRSFVDLF